MLGKLIKHDFRALSRTLFPLQIGILAAALAASLLMTVDLRISRMSNVSAAVLALFTGVSAMLTVIVGLAIAASVLVTLLLICVHFYRNLMGDQGYLTFTLPTTTGRILWSKLITGMIWVVINLVVVALAALIFSVFGTASSGVMNPEVLDTLRSIFTGMPSLGEYVHVGLLYFLLIVLALLTLASALLQAYFAITVGGRAAKHRLLASIGMYIALSMAMNIVRTVVMLCFSFGPLGVLELSTAADMGEWFIHSALIWASVLAAAFGAAFFLGSRAILKNKLNLQ